MHWKHSLCLLNFLTYNTLIHKTAHGRAQGLYAARRWHKCDSRSTALELHTLAQADLDCVTLAKTKAALGPGIQQGDRQGL